MKPSIGYHAPGAGLQDAATVRTWGEILAGDFIDIQAEPGELLQRLGKDPRLVSYGGANFGTPLSLIGPDSGRTLPNERFFVRSNGPVPLLDNDSWRLDISGIVERPQSLSLADLKLLQPRSLESFLECAGNGRTRFDPVPPGTPWRNDAIGNAVWEGIALADVLDLAGPRPATVDIVTQGADFPEMRRGLPLAVARDSETLIVWKMNGERLPVAHGGPVRLLVPGWAGIASTKWLIGLEAIDRAFDGFWNTDNYVFWDEQGNPLRPIAEMPPKSVIIKPADGELIAAGTVAIAGWAWSGYGRIQRVEVSTDGGRTWDDANLQESERRSWRRWETVWSAESGNHRLMARATDERGLTQPAQAAWNAKGYLMNAIHQITVPVDS